MLERDDTPMPADADAAFEWQRTGAPQVRHSHAFLARLRNLLRDRAPDVLDALLDAGATEIPFTENLPETLTDQSPASRRRRAGRARVPAHDVRVGAAPAACSRSPASSSATVSPPAALDADAGAVPRVVGVDGVARRSRRRRARSAVVVGRLARGDRRGSRSPKSCTRAASSTSRASTACASGVDGAAVRRADRRRSRLPEVRDLPRRQPHVLDHVRDREPRRGAAPRARRDRGVRDGRPVARRDRAVARRRRRRPDHRRARHGRAAQPLPAARRRRRRAARARLRRGRRRVGVHEPALRARLQPGVRARVRSRRRAARARRRSRRLARAFAEFTDRELRPVVPLRGAAGRAGAARCTRSCRPKTRGRSCKPCSATACCPRCARRRSCSARSCAGSTCWRRPTRSMADPEIVAEVLAAYEDRDEPPRRRPSSAPTASRSPTSWRALGARRRRVSRRGARARSRVMSATWGRIAFSSDGSYATNVSVGARGATPARRGTRSTRRRRTRRSRRRSRT